MNTKKPSCLLHFLWDAWCCLSVIGIWPRFIEPNLITTATLERSLSHLPPALDGLKILQFSDLHLNRQMGDFFLRKLLRKVRQISPHLIVFTGDFLCYGAMRDRERLQKLLCAMSAPYGCYAILGNHDYSAFVSINEEGDYDLLTPKGSPLAKGFRRLFSTSVALTGKVTERARAVGMNQELVELLEKTPFQLLHNQNQLVKIGDSYLNICGLGEYMAGKFLPEVAFQEYDERHPGLILSHNPDTLPALRAYPGDIVLCGHTHGGQVNLPWLWKRFTIMENREFAKGEIELGEKWAYVNRGLGGVLDFRWCAPPELLVLNLRKGER